MYRSIFVFNPIFLLKLDALALQITPHITFSYAFSATITFGAAVTTIYSMQRHVKLTMQRTNTFKTLIRALNLLHWHIYGIFDILLQTPYKKMDFLFVSSTLIISLRNAIVGIVSKMIIGANLHNSSICNANQRNRCVLVYIMAL